MSDSTRNREIRLTQPSLPPLEEFVPLLEKIWSTSMLSNCGPMHQQLESEMAAYLGVPFISLFNNGTTALLVGLQVLDVSGEVITTPYSFAATAHSILWNGLTPVFADIEDKTFNIAPGAVEAAITSRTVAIMPVHCYGNPCDVQRIETIAERHGLKVIYDAAHAFGVHYKGESVLRYGDVSVLSFHATKVFSTIEGGAIVSQDAASKARIDRLRNFGIAGDELISEVGLNGKMNEVQAAFGLLQLRQIGDALRRRQEVDAIYREQISDVEGITCLPPAADTVSNFAYFPVLVGPQAATDRDQIYTRMRERCIFARKYFYPLLSSFPMYRELPSAAPGNLPNATRVAREVLCLPMHQNLSDADIAAVVDAVRS